MVLGASFLQLLGKVHQQIGRLVLEVVRWIVEELQQLLLVVHVVLEPHTLGIARGLDGYAILIDSCLDLRRHQWLLDSLHGRILALHVSPLRLILPLHQCILILRQYGSRRII